MINRNIQLSLERERESEKQRKNKTERKNKRDREKKQYTHDINYPCTYTLTTGAMHALVPNCLIPYTVRNQSGLSLFDFNNYYFKMFL